MPENKISFFNIVIDNLSMSETLATIDEFVASDKHQIVVTPNVDHLVKLQTDKVFLSAYQSANLVLTDGVPLLWAAKIMGTPVKEKVSGSDLFPKLCERAALKKHSLFFLGGLEGVAEKASRKLKEDYPGLNVTGVYSPPFGFENEALENEKILKLINMHKPDILCVGLGAPKQEKWLYKHRDQLKVRVSLGIGASFDFVAGNVQRAPIWMQNNGLEWFYRTMQEPKRMLKRYFIDAVLFIPLIVKYWFKNKRAGDVLSSRY